MDLQSSSSSSGIKYRILAFGKNEKYATKVDKEFFFHGSAIIWFFLHTHGLYGNNFLKLGMNSHCNVFKEAIQRSEGESGSQLLDEMPLGILSVISMIERMRVPTPPPPQKREFGS